MKRVLLAIVLAIGACLAYGEVKDWRDLEKLHKHIQESIRELERARAANHYDTRGHGERAEQLLREAERELHDAIEAAKKH